MKVLLDTNVLFSGLGFKGLENRIIWLAILGKINLTISDYILAELKRNIDSKFTGHRKKKAFELINRLIISQTIEIKSRKEYGRFLNECKDLINEKDSPIVACAMLEDIDVLITGDKDFHTKKVRNKINVMTTREFLEKH